jgi:hypothetical protein
MEVWALEAYGASHTLKEMLTIKSDDMLGRTQAYSAMVQGKEIPDSSVPETFKLLVRKLNGLGLGLEAYSSEENVVQTDTAVEEVPQGKTESSTGEVVKEINIESSEEGADKE